MKNNLIRGIRKASDFLMALAADRRVQARRAAESAGAAAGGRDRRRSDRHRHRDRAVCVLPGAGREDARLQYETLERRVRRRAPARDLRRRRARAARRVPRARRGRSAPSALGPARAGEAPNFVPLVRSWGGVTHRLPQADGRFAGVSPESRRGHQGARGRHRASSRT